MTFLEVAERVRGTDNPLMKEAFFKGRAALESIEQNHQTPTLIPALEVARTKIYGYELYSKAALLTENQFVSAFKKTPQQLAVNAVAMEETGLGQKKNYYPVSLAPGLPSSSCCSRRLVGRPSSRPATRHS